MTDYERIRAILDAATPGPWYRWHGDDDHCMNAYGMDRVFAVGSAMARDARSDDAKETLP